MKNFICISITIFVATLLPLSCFHENQLEKLTAYNESGGSDSPVYIHVLEVTPAAGGLNVSVNTNISVQFDDNIEMSTVSTSTFSVNGGAVPGSFSYSVQTKTVTFNPASALDDNTTYTVILTRGITNPVGETLASGYSWSFTTTASPQPNIEVSSTLGLLNSGGTWDYGSVLTGSFKPAVFTISNSGSSDLAITSSILAGADAGQFSIDVSPASPLTPGSTTGITVDFEPDSAGSKNAVLTIDSNDPNDPVFIINLTGRGLDAGGGEPEIQVTLNGTDVISGSTKVSFGTIPLGSSMDITLVMSNIGSADLTISSVSIIGENPDKFSTNFLSLYSPLPFSIASGENKEFKITFTPGFDRGMKQAEIRFINNDSDESPFIILVRGRGS